MYENFQYQTITYQTEAPGWIEEVYYPRVPEVTPVALPFRGEDGSYQIHSRVWQEIEETGYGIYYYEETTQLVTQLEGSDYEVRVVLTNPTDTAYSCHIRCNRVVKQASVTVEAHSSCEVTLLACLTTGELVLSLAAGELSAITDKITEGDIYVENVEITPRAAAERRQKPAVYLLSDSTVQCYQPSHYPQMGWGQVFFEYFEGAEECKEYRSPKSSYEFARTFELPELLIDNRSIGGRSARSFYEEGKLDEALEQLCPGDYVLVQFAHNDNSNIRPNRYSSPEEYPTWLRVYIEACRRRGAVCVLVTAVTMRIFDEDGSFKIAFPQYRDKMLETAAEENLPLLDLGLRSTQYLNSIGEEESKNIYLWVEEGEYPDSVYAQGVSDRAHLQEYGARIYANIVAHMIAEYDKDDRLDTLKALVRPKAFADIPKPEKRVADLAGKTKAESDRVDGFVVQEISVENNRGSFLLNWNSKQGAVSYRVYARKKSGEDPFRLVGTVTKEQKEAMAILPFSAPAGFVWEYCVAAVFAEGREGRTSRTAEVCLK